MKSNPEISIITPVWNGLPYIKEAVESVLAQEFTNWELIISDNCSTDGTPEYLDSLTDPRIRIYKQVENLGIFGNMNFLCEKIQAPVCKILCADDYFLNKSALTTILDVWEKQSTEVGLVRFNFEFDSPSLKITPQLITSDKSALFFYVHGNLLGNLSDVSFRSTVFNATNRFNKDLFYAGDFEYWCRVAEQWHLFLTEEKVVYVRRHEAVASNYLNVNGELVSQIAFIMEYLYQKLLNNKSSFEKIFWLKVVGTVIFYIPQRYMALKNIVINKNFKYNKSLQQNPFVKFYLNNWFVKHILMIMTCNGKWGKEFAIKKVINAFK